MNSKARVQSVLEVHALSEEVTQMPCFSMNHLQDVSVTGIEIPTNIRLGQLIEKVVGDLLDKSSTYQLLYKNVQVLDGKRTIGELDFIIQEKETTDIIHLELAYKFYLLDSHISSTEKENWIGPNRKDTLVEKLVKLKTKQFPLLFDSRTQKTLRELDVSLLRQELCLLANLFIPYEYNGNVSEAYLPAIKGWYLNWVDYQKMDHEATQYYVPEKKQWGMAPLSNDSWFSFQEVHQELQESISENQSRLVWQRKEETYSEFFVTWW